MALTLNGSANTIAGVAVGGLPDGIVDTDMLAANAVTKAKATGGRSLLEADQWRCTADFSASSQDFMSNWERVDSDSFTQLGTGISQSSGYWSFPNTGLWLIEFSVACWHNSYDRRFIYNKILTTTNNSSYAVRSESYSNVSDPTSDAYYTSCHTNYLFDVTDVANCKFYVSAQADGSITWIGHTDLNQTSITCTRLGDT